MELRLDHLPLFFHLFGVAALAMLVPSIHALVSENYAEARSFFYTGLLGLFFLFMIAIAASNRKIMESGVQQLASLAFGLLLLPVFLAIPEYDIIQNTYFINAYFDMVSALTTTGIVVFEAERISDTLHLWRALVAWMGGALIWLAAAAILAPMNLGGFEVAADRNVQKAHFLTVVERKKFLKRMTIALFPLYVSLTACLWLGLTISGIPGFDSLIFAMSILATSGITGVNEINDFGANWVAEFIMLLFLFLALSRGKMERGRGYWGASILPSGPELRLGMTIIAFLVFFLAMMQLYTVGSADMPLFGISTIKAIWADIFTVTSFLTTNGWSSAYWLDVQNWSGFSVPGILFLGIVLIGGGVATTAGGVKLLRVYALYANAVREIDRLVHPSSVGQTRSVYQSELRSKAFIAWIFFMLFAISLALITLALAGAGMDFEVALVSCVSALSTTGPLMNMVFGDGIDFIAIGTASKLIMSFGMVLGRLEILVLLALFTPEIWRS
jgi:trk system potassium uptake protein TrkH